MIRHVLWRYKKLLQYLVKQQLYSLAIMINVLNWQKILWERAMIFYKDENHVIHANNRCRLKYFTMPQTCCIYRVPYGKKRTTVVRN